MSYIETASGKLYHFLNPQPDEIVIEDIALALANKCRFGGHSDFYSVAEHSVLVALRLPPGLQLAGLLHDASEAYLGDIPSPIKDVLPDYKKLENINQTAIEQKFGLDLSMDDFKKIKMADLAALRTEAHYLMTSKGTGNWWKALEHLPVEHEYAPKKLAPVYAYAVFMDLFKELTQKLEAKLVYV
jgi:5'-deoxynucleotidase YfbR-like HD superfamily hydrolase